MRSIDGPKSNGQRLFEAFKRIKKNGFGKIGMPPFSNLRPSEMAMMHSILHRMKKQAETEGFCFDHLPEEIICNTDKNGKQRADGLTISELSKFNRMTPSAVSQIVKALEEKGYVRRSLSPADRRVVFVSISKEGYRILQEAEETFMNYLEEITGMLGEEDTDRLIELLEKLADIIPPENKKTT